MTTLRNRRECQQGPRPLSTTLYETKPNEIIHFYYLFLEESDGDSMYVLVVEDNLSGYCWLEPTANAEALARWSRVFTAPDVWVSDQGSHSKNAVMEQLASKNRIRHTFRRLLPLG